MKRNLMIKLGLTAFLAVAATCVPANSFAQTSTNKAAAKKAASTASATPDAPKKAHPFHGKLAAVDKNAKTITLGKSTYHIGSETKMKKADKPATLDDAVVGEDVGGYVKPNEAGAMVVTSVTFGPKTDAKTTTKKAAKAAK